jgi:hypothetical protein
MSPADGGRPGRDGALASGDIGRARLDPPIRCQVMPDHVPMAVPDGTERARRCSTSCERYPRSTALITPARSCRCDGVIGTDCRRERQQGPTDSLPGTPQWTARPGPDVEQTCSQPASPEDRSIIELSQDIDELWRRGPAELDELRKLRGGAKDGFSRLAEVWGVPRSRWTPM